MEYYFDYQITEISGGDMVEAPKLYFERSYDNNALPYSLYAVPYEWAKKKSNTTNKPEVSENIYDRIEVVFDLNGIDCASLSDKGGDAYRRAELKPEPYTIDNFRKNGNRLIINATGSMDNAGVGIIEMFRGANSVAKFFFAVNFTFRKKIQYVINKNNDRLEILFNCEGKPEGVRANEKIKVNVVYNTDRLPCLKTDARVNIVGTYNLDFSKSTRRIEPIDMRRKGIPPQAKVSVVFADENVEKYYILDCDKNDTVSPANPPARLAFNNYSCPYCHKPINAKLGDTKEYRRGGTSCMLNSNQKVIEYKLKYTPLKSGDNATLDLEFNCKSDIVAKISIVAPGRVVAGPITLDFSDENKIKRTETIAALPENTELKVTFATNPPVTSRIDRASSSYYSLKCLSNNTVASLKSLNFMPEIFDEHGLAKKCMYCAGDLAENNPLALTTMRLLPPRFMEHDSFKIAFMGSTRAGKTTYISRMFGITGSERVVNMNMTKLENSLNRFGINVQPATMALVEMKTNNYGSNYVATDKNWSSTQEQYVKRAISIDPPLFPAPTNEADYTGYPFIVEVDGDSYVSFYDIAGENAEMSRRIQKIASNDDPIGIFYIINGVEDREGTIKVTNMLNEISSGNNDNIKKCPVAVIVTKMDLLENRFDSNSKCLRTDYFQSMRKYNGSEVQKMIDRSSEEIRSYLTCESLLPDLKFENVKYFGISSFTFTDSIHNDGDNNNEKGNVYFDCSAKHFELPFVWMMKQFGIIN